MARDTLSLSFKAREGKQSKARSKTKKQTGSHPVAQAAFHKPPAWVSLVLGLQVCTWLLVNFSKNSNVCVVYVTLQVRDSGSSGRDLEAVK